MKRIIFFIFFLVPLFLLSFLAIADNPPSLINFQQFYGEVKDLPEGTYKVRAVVEGVNYETPIAEGKYGYSPTFKVYGQNGPIVAFYLVDALNMAVSIRNETYQSQAITKLDLPYPVVRPTVEEEGESTTSTEETSTSQTTTPLTNQTTTGSCLYSWDCSLWMACQNGQQTRICFRSDNCLQRQSRGEVREIIPLEKPAEQRSCEVEAAAGKVCPANEKRCQGRELQQCSADGMRWLSLQFCSQGCDASAFTCLPVSPAEVRKPGISAWPYFLGGSVILVVVIILIVISFFRRKKYGPVGEYIKEARKKGLSGSQIRARLFSQGWEEEEIRKVLK